MGKKKRFGFEFLEPRHALTGISAVLDHGVLTINATDTTSNTVQLNYAGGKLKIAETGQVFSVRQIHEIDMNLQGATDVVDMHNDTWYTTMVITSAGGDDSLLFHGGKHYYFGDDQRTVNINAHGDVTIDGRKPNWFDMHVPQNNVGVLVRQLAADGVLTRDDMLQIFSLVEQSTTVGSENFATLQTIVGNAGLFTNVSYVQSLANLVVNPSVANALYQQSALGNLAATSTAAHLTLLVDKWFLGTDHPEASDGNIAFTWRDVEGTLFNGPAVMQQIHQGPDDDCYFLSGMEAIAIHDPQDIENMFIDNGDGTYSVRFFNGKKAVWLTIDSELPIETSSGYFVYDDENLQYNNPDNVLWSAFAEKAYAQLAELGWSRPGDAVNSYDAINYGDAYKVMAQITGQPAKDYPVTSTTASHIAQLFMSNHPVAFNSDQSVSDPHIADDHVYALVGYNAQTNEFELFNPWGFNNHTSDPALIWLTWHEITEFYAYAHVGSVV